MTELPDTERRNPRSMTLGGMSAAEAVGLMATEDAAVLDATAAAGESIAKAADQIAAVYSGGGRTVFLGAGTSGRLAIQEVAELRPTFGVAEGRFLALVAGGPSTGPAAITRSEDDRDAVGTAFAALGIGRGDAVVGLAASGTTPFVLAGIEAAQAAGAWTCGIANNPRTPLLGLCDLPILLATGPEVLTGSTRLKAGTAQKICLNRITTAAMVVAGRVVENHMVDVVVSIDKLQHRAVRIVSDLAGIEGASARALLEQHGWNVREALDAPRR